MPRVVAARKAAFVHSNEADLWRKQPVMRPQKYGYVEGNAQQPTTPSWSKPKSMDVSKKARNKPSRLHGDGAS